MFTMLSLNGCNSVNIKSEWLTNKIAIDGNQNDWQTGINYLDDEGVGLGIKNDDKNLYLCLIVNDQSKIISIMRAGLTIWFNSPNDDKNTIGIEYPIHKKRGAGEVNENFRSGNRPEFDPKAMFERFMQNQKEYLIVNKDKFPLTEYWVGSNANIDLKVNVNMGRLVYELKIPLAYADSLKYHVDAKVGDKFNLSFETNEIQRPSRSGGFGGEGMEGGEIGGMRRGGRKRGGNYEGERKAPEKIEFTANVQLADSSLIGN